MPLSLLTALFTARLHQRSGTLAVMFATGALLLGGSLPTIWLSDHAAPTAIALGSDVLLVLHERRFAYEGLTILALVFTGTLLYRGQRGQIGRWPSGTSPGWRPSPQWCSLVRCRAALR